MQTGYKTSRSRNRVEMINVKSYKVAIPSSERVNLTPHYCNFWLKPLQDFAVAAFWPGGSNINAEKLKI